jgi:tripartite-type tricarboxylate transporter receptor subunit TctC
MISRFLFIRLCGIGSIVLSLYLGIGGSEIYARSEYPDKPITIINSSKAGGFVDVMSRKIAELSKKYINVPMIVENAPGGSGAAAMNRVLNRRADGYTILAVLKSYITTTLIAETGIDFDDFRLLACMVFDPEAIITNRHAPVSTLEEVIADAKKQGGNQRWVGPMIGGVDHLMALKTWETCGISGTWIPFEGSAPSIVALLARDGVVYVGNPVDVIGRPDLMIAAVASHERLKDFPQVSTFKEKGYDLEEIMWRGYAVKQGTSPEIIKFLEQFFLKISRDPEWIEFLENASAQPVFLEGNAFGNIVKEDTKQAKYLLKRAGIIRDSEANQLVRLLLIFILIISGVFAVYSILIRLKKEKLSRDLVIAAAVIAISLFFLYITFNFPGSNLSGQTGPATMPRIYLFALIGVAIWLTCITLTKNQIQSRSSKQLKSVYIFILLMILYIVFINITGYQISTFIFIVCGLFSLKYRKTFVTIIIASVFVVLTYLIFQYFLKIPLPTGMLLE